VDDNDEVAALLAEARKGNNQALSVLLDRLRTWIRGRAQVLLGQGLHARMDGSDVAQEVHARIWQEFVEFKGQSVPELRAWIDKILQHHITDCRRHHGAGKRDAGREVGGSDPFSDLAGQGTTPSQGAMRNEQQARLDEALEQLPENQREVFRLRFCEGLSFEEVAHRVGVTASNARVLMVRAMDRLRNELGESHE
jgi:RNA polymerase sigma-70 factor (ECF subfamily)